MAVECTVIKQIIEVTNDVPGYTDVMYEILWMMEWKDVDAYGPDVKVTNGGGTILPIDTATLEAGFTPASEVTDAQIQEWVLDSMVDLDALREEQTRRLAVEAEKPSRTVFYDVNDPA